jgi:hypothetical protein
VELLQRQLVQLLLVHRQLVLLALRVLQLVVWLEALLARALAWLQGVLAWRLLCHFPLPAQLLADGQVLLSRSLASVLHQHGQYLLQSVVALSL